MRQCWKKGGEKEDKEEAAESTVWARFGSAHAALRRVVGQGLDDDKSRCLG